MKWIGQHIYDQVSRFRNDVYINGDYFYVTSDNSRFISTEANDPLVQIRNERADSNGARLRFMKQRLNEEGTAAVDGVDNDVCGTIEFYSYDDGTPSTQNYAQIQGTIHDATSGEESGKLTLGVASHDGGVENGLVLTGGSVDAEVDVTIGNGSASVTTITGDAIVTGGFTFDSVALTRITTSSESFADNDVSLMTSAAIDDRILSYGYSTASGDITGVSITTDSGGGSKAEDTGGSADFSILGANGVGVTNSGTTITAAAVPGEIDHDSLQNFVANEHIDWTGSSAGTIHSSNIPTLNQDTTGSAATLTTARAINGVNFDGSAAITIPTRVHGSTIKILPTDFIPNEDGGTSKGVFLDDDGTTGLKPGIAQMELIAVVIIPENYKATHVDIFDNSHDLAVNVFEMNVNASGQTSKGSGNANTTIDITDVNATATNYLAIEVVTTATTERVFGGSVTIAAQ